VFVMKSASSVSRQYSSGGNVVTAGVMVFRVRVLEGPCMLEGGFKWLWDGCDIALVPGIGSAPGGCEVSRLGVGMLVGRCMFLIVPVELTGMGASGYVGWLLLRVAGMVPGIPIDVGVLSVAK
jgi:hypothetical protein